MKITNITRDKHVKERFYVKVLGHESFTVSAETIVKYNLRVGQEIDEAFWQTTLIEDEKKRAVDASLKLLSFSQRSKKELVERLKLKGYSQPAVEHAIARLSELGYINDTTYAKNLILVRRSQGKGTELIKFEMKRKGIPSDVISEAIKENSLTTQSEAEQILPLARKKLTQMRNVPRDVALKRLMGFLARRGFSIEAVQSVLRKLKKE